MVKNEKHIDGYILAGGKSSRMGSDKGLLNFQGKPLVQWVIEQLSPAVKNVILVSNNIEYQQFGLTVIPDLIKDRGPAGGIYASLSHANTEQIFVVACDMPFITTDIIRYIIEHAVKSQITLVEQNGQLQPLCGIYDKECVTLWQQLVWQEKLKLQEIVTNFTLLKLKLPHQLFNDSLFFNINNKQDFQQAFNKIDHGD
ncbi:MAG: molybdenum cofactor guanylyltransferase [Chitinophagaceae bacterium]